MTDRKLIPLDEVLQRVDALNRLIRELRRNLQPPSSAASERTQPPLDRGQQP